MIDRAGGWVEWSGLVKRMAGAGDGNWGVRGDRGRGSDHSLINDCGTMMTGLCVLRETRVFRKVHYRWFGRGGCGSCGGGDGGWSVVVVVVVVVCV